MEYKVIKSKRRTIAIEVNDCGVIVRAPYWYTKAKIDKFVEDHETWIREHEIKLKERNIKRSSLERISCVEIEELREKAKLVIPKRVERFAELMGLSYCNVTIKLLKKRWGSCSNKKNLNFNLLLMLAPDDVIDSVIIHELAHLKHMNHGPLFYKEVLKYCPNYKECDRWLKDKGNDILYRAFK